MSTRPGKPHSIVLAVLLVYLVVHFGFTQWFESLEFYASYVFEFLVVVVAGFYYRDRIQLSYPVRLQFAWDYGLALACGGVVFLLTKPLRIFVPFDFASTETVLFLLVIGPVLEEFLFRMALWDPLFDLVNGRWQITLAINCFLFTYSHFHAYWFVSGELRPFIIYQTIYVIPLSLACGWRRWQTGSMAPPIAIHLGFNMGFFLAALV